MALKGDQPYQLQFQSSAAKLSANIRKSDSTNMFKLPDDKLISLEMSLLHFKIEARSAALSVDSWSSWALILC